MKIKPTFHRLVVKPISDTEILKVQLALRGSNLHLPNEISQDKVMQGIVIEVGGGRILSNGAMCAVHIPKGSRVVFNRFSGTEVSIDGERFFIVSEDDIICTLIPEEKDAEKPEVVATERE